MEINLLTWLDLLLKKNQIFSEAAGLYLLRSDISSSSSIKTNQFSNDQYNFPLPKPHAQSKYEKSSDQSVLAFPKKHAQSKHVESSEESLFSVFEKTLSLDICIESYMNAKDNVSEIFDSNKFWHYRLGHLPLSSMKYIKEISIQHHNKHEFPCDIFHMSEEPLVLPPSISSPSISPNSSPHTPSTSSTDPSIDLVLIIKSSPISNPPIPTSSPPIPSPTDQTHMDMLPQGQKLQRSTG
ncbi:uncharacterized protein LOC132054110 [Lycium ferocissimum]|uniref:uncharacterized protein LOC132054110 n=1 Tax=Lycium ferocissimum TaxID=112874 RepID=UPI002814BA1F|nr:uncharacterized protein LOC132054110 [Lycium ferocissimum]